MQTPLNYIETTESVLRDMPREVVKDYKVWMYMYWSTIVVPVFYSYMCALYVCDEARSGKSILSLLYADLNLVVLFTWNLTRFQAHTMYVAQIMLHKNF